MDNQKGTNIMTITLQDMRDALKDPRKAEEAIFFFCNAWHSGVDSDLYKAMVESKFSPDQHRQQQIENDPEILYCFDILGTKFGPFIEAALLPVKLADVKENDVLTAGNSFACIFTGWPCRVHLWNGRPCVYCAEDVKYQYHHPLEPDERGYVKGFRR